MPFENVNGMRIYYEIHGDGDTILLLHHGFGCTKIWKNIYPILVENGYRVITYDRRGYGQSERGAEGSLQSFPTVGTIPMKINPKNISVVS